MEFLASVDWGFLGCVVIIAAGSFGFGRVSAPPRWIAYRPDGEIVEVGDHVHEFDHIRKGHWCCRLCEQPIETADPAMARRKGYLK